MADRSHAVIVRTRLLDGETCDGHIAQIEASFVVVQAYSVRDICTTIALILGTILAMRGYRARFVRRDKQVVPAAEDTPRVKLDVRLALVFGGLAIAYALHSSNSFNGHLVDWRPGFSVVLLAFGFVRLISKRHFAEGVRHWLLRFRWIDKPAVAIWVAVVMTFVVNMIITSASAACALLAVVLVPLLVSVGVSPDNAGAAVMLGTWGGFLSASDFGASYLSDILARNHLSPLHLTSHIAPSLCALLVMTFLFSRAIVHVSRTAPADQEIAKASMSQLRRSVPKGASIGAIVTLLPILLFGVFKVVEVAFRIKTDPTTELSGAFGLALAVALTFRRDKITPVSLVWDDFKTVLLGAWHGFLDVIMLIVAARVFSAPLSGIISLLPTGALALFFILSFALALIIGSGDGTVATLVGIVVPSFKGHGIGAAVGSSLWLGTELGRCASPNSPALRALISSVGQQGAASRQGSTIKESQACIDMNAEEIVRPLWGPVLCGLLAGYAVIWLQWLLLGS